jgi:hypothetical protein
MLTGVLSQGEGGRNVQLTTELNLVPVLRMSGAILLLRLHAFMARAGNTLHLYLLSNF